MTAVLHRVERREAVDGGGAGEERVGDRAEGAIINAGHVVKLRALEAIATFPAEGRTLNYKH